MMIKKSWQAAILFVFGFVFGMNEALWAQEGEIPAGAWRTHFSYHEAKRIALTPEDVYCASQNGLFRIGKEDLYLQKIGKNEGLSDAGISALAYDSHSEFLLIAYANGNIDLIRDNRITNMPDLMNSTLFDSKKIHHVIFDQGIAYLSADFGIVVIDCEQGLLKDTYTNLSDQGDLLRVNSLQIWNGILYAATEDGVIAGEISDNVNLKDFESWSRLGEDHISLRGVQRHMAFHQNKIYVASVNHLSSFDGNQSEIVYTTVDAEISSLISNDGKLTMIEEDKAWEVSDNGQLQAFNDELVQSPNELWFEGNVFWVADDLNGLVTNVEGKSKHYYPSGPLVDNVTGFGYHENKIYIVNGEIFQDVPKGNKPNLSMFSKGEWMNYNQENIPSFESDYITDLTDVLYSTTMNTEVLASFSNGVLFFDKENLSYDLINAGTNGALFQTDSYGNTNISCIEEDYAGRLWAVNYGNDQTLHLYDPYESAWQAFSTNNSLGKYAVDLKMSFNGDKWLQISRQKGGGIIVFNEEEARSIYLSGATVPDMPTNGINKLVIDREGIPWIVSSNGIGYFPNYYSALDGGVFYERPIHEGKYLFNNELVNTIAIDGGNRKWVGKNDGLWLFNDNADALIQKFTTDNSPLLSNIVLNLEMNHETGEMFVYTSAGLVSVRTDATRGSKSQASRLKIYPNPVETSSFAGPVTISNLVEDATVKIATASGKLVFEGEANGGTIQWDLTDDSGNKVVSGVYVVYVSDFEGKETTVDKLIVIN
ncbi:type IX secretion system anionic LPS delivery protein PorZ [Aureibacter tunicatorum]|uniref:PorZ N-terminal beta-propeller domain-containing protein n=1 Tax=Aureibacter tunicatorum TaxID=866807 RepID=A0AAE3XJ68_9BACT|nr:T9SS type A sorting domain-containing protein [Aureibacter tunicatorum]MDR6238731.1 hypothetical protein [Aureibacter tunicatorum]BDD05338.1 hypothetical protein AUTU_28210 [Aureibacter tunicatorum]